MAREVDEKVLSILKYDVARARSLPLEKRFDAVDTAYSILFGKSFPFGFGAPSTFEEAIPIIENCIVTGEPYRVDAPEALLFSSSLACLIIIGSRPERPFPCRLEASMASDHADLDLDARKARLGAELAMKKRVETIAGASYVLEDDGSRTGPVCKRCYDEKGLTIRLVRWYGKGARCANCGTVYPGIESGIDDPKAQRVSW